MKKFFFPVIFLILIKTNLFPVTPAHDILYHITQDMNSFSTLFPLKEGSENEKKVVRMILDRLDSEGIEYTVHGLSESEEYPSESVIIDARFNGESGDEIFLVFPLGSSAFNLAEALLLSEQLNTAPLANTVHILFMGAEYGKAADYPLGTNEYLKIYYPKGNPAFFYFDISGVPAKIELLTAGTGTISPLWMVKKSLDTLNNSRFLYSYRQRLNIIYKLGLNDKPSLIDPYFKESYPAVLFRAEGTTRADKQTVENYYNFIRTIAADRNWKIQSDLNWDKHYLIVFAGKKILYISELNYILFLITLLSLILLYPFISTGRFSKYLRSIIQYVWTLPILFAMVFLFLFISTFAVKSLLLIRNFESLWEYTPILVIIFKLVVASFLFLISLRLFRFFKFSQRGSFYSASSILFILIDVLAVLSIDISFAFYLVPVLFSIFVFTIVRNRWAKLFFLLLSASILVFAASKMFYSESNRIVSLLILSPVYGNLLITANLLPILLMIYRIRFLFHNKNGILTKRMILTLDLSLGLISVFMYVYLVLFSPFSPENPQPLEILESVDIDNGSSNFTLSSPAPLGTFSFTTGNGTVPYNIKKRSIIIESPRPGSGLASVPVIALRKNRFLNRLEYTLSYSYTAPPESLDISLLSDKEIIIYDSNYPYSASGDFSRIDFKTGSVPHSYFTLVFTLPKDSNGEIRITGKYNTSSGKSPVTGHPFAVHRSLIFKKKLLISNSD